MFSLHCKCEDAECGHNKYVARSQGSQDSHIYFNFDYILVALFAITICNITEETKWRANEKQHWKDIKVGES